MPVSILLTLVISACGPKANLGFNKTKENQPITVMQALSRCNSNGPEELLRELESLAQKQQFALSWLSRFNLTKIKQRTSESFISRADVTTKAKALLQHPQLLKQYSTIEAISGAHQILQELADVLNQYRRLTFLECHMQAYWSLGKIPYDAYLAGIEGDRSVSTVAKLCQVDKGAALCFSQASVAKRQGKLEAMYAQYILSFEQRFVLPRFRMVDQLSSITCDKTAAATIINVATSASGQELALLHAAAGWWQSSDQKIQLRVVSSTDSQAVYIEHTDHGPSHVSNDARHRINLAPGHAQPIVVAHELGHSLGFPDCYFESWDKDRRGFVYFELPEHTENLMCSIHTQAKIPDDYFVQLEQAYCRD